AGAGQGHRADRIAIHQAGGGEAGQGRRGAVGLRGIARGDHQGGRRHRQRAVDIGDRVVGEARAGGGTRGGRVLADGRRGGGEGAGAGQGHRADPVAVHQAGGGEAGQGRRGAVGLRGIARGDHQGGRRHRQRAVDIGDRVVGEARAGGGTRGDRVLADSRR